MRGVGLRHERLPADRAAASSPGSSRITAFCGAGEGDFPKRPRAGRRDRQRAPSSITSSRSIRRASPETCSPGQSCPTASSQASDERVCGGRATYPQLRRGTPPDNSHAATAFPRPRANDRISALLDDHRQRIMHDVEEVLKQGHPQPQHEARERICPMRGEPLQGAWAGNRICASAGRGRAGAAAAIPWRTDGYRGDAVGRTVHGSRRRIGDLRPCALCAHGRSGVRGGPQKGRPRVLPSGRVSVPGHWATVRRSRGARG